MLRSTIFHSPNYRKEGSFITLVSPCQNIVCALYDCLVVTVVCHWSVGVHTLTVQLLEMIMWIVLLGVDSPGSTVIMAPGYHGNIKV